MNYLAHSFLSFGSPTLLTGNMIGDHVKGKLALDHYPEGIRNGIMLHRKIDAFADAHIANQRAKLFFRGTYGLYAGAIIDILYDHFLANDPKYFSNEGALLAFSQQVYAQLATQSAWFPKDFEAYFQYMQQHNWLYDYRTMKGMEQSLNGLARRAKYMPPIAPAYEIFVTNYYILNQCYFDFIEDMVRFVKNELNNNVI